MKYEETKKSTKYEMQNINKKKPSFLQASDLILQRGVAIYLAILIMAVLLAIALGITTILIGQIKISREIENSVVAIYAADTGIEHILYEEKLCRKSGCPAYCKSICSGLPETYTIGVPDPILLDNGATYSVTVNYGTENGEEKVQFKSIGEYKGVKRAIETSMPRAQRPPQVLEIFPATPVGPGNCIPFGSCRYGTYKGFIYKNIPAFGVNPGGTISFDLGAENDYDIAMNIWMGETTVNGGNTLKDPPGYTQIVSGATALTPRGNTVKGDYELTFTIDNTYSFPGGGLIIKFQAVTPFTLDVTCTQVLMSTDSSDASGYFAYRWYYDVIGNDTSLIGGFRLVY